MSIRLSELDALRGLAAFQVILLHYAAAFLPLAAGVGGQRHTALDATIRQSPFFFLIDGYSAVYLFFLISGFVLGPAFAQALFFLRRMVFGRVVRLLMPVLLSAPLALLAALVWSQVATGAVETTGSQWLAALLHTGSSLLPLLRDIFLDGTLLGYRGQSVFGTAEWLSPIGIALNPPLWTLAFEVWGSLLLLFFTVLLRPFAAPIRVLAASALIVFVTGSGELSLFLLGYLLSLGRQRLLTLPSSLAVLGVSAALLLAGIYLCVTKASAPLAALLSAWGGISLFAMPSEFHFVSACGAVLVFLGVLINPVLRRLLQAPLLLRLGQLSFSLYLLHFPVMIALAMPIFLGLHLVLPYLLAALLASIAGITATVFLARAYYRHIDLWAMDISRRITRGGPARPHGEGE